MYINVVLRRLVLTASFIVALTTSFYASLHSSSSLPPSLRWRILDDAEECAQSAGTWHAASATCSVADFELVAEKFYVPVTVTLKISHSLVNTYVVSRMDTGELAGYFPTPGHLLIDGGVQSKGPAVNRSLLENRGELHVSNTMTNAAAEGLACWYSPGFGGYWSCDPIYVGGAIVNRRSMTISGQLRNYGSVANLGQLTVARPKGETVPQFERDFRARSAMAEAAVDTLHAGLVSMAVFTNSGQVDIEGILHIASGERPYGYDRRLFTNDGRIAVRGAVVADSSTNLQNSGVISISGILIASGYVGNTGELSGDGVIVNRGTMVNKGTVACLIYNEGIVHSTGRVDAEIFGPGEFVQFDQHVYLPFLVRDTPWQ